MNNNTGDVSFTDLVPASQLLQIKKRGGNSLYIPK